jgi:hypothetical protein
LAPFKVVMPADMDRSQLFRGAAPWKGRFRRRIENASLERGFCLELGPDDPLGDARRLRTTTFFGAFELDPATGLQRGHRLSVVRWGRARQELLLAEAG